MSIIINQNACVGCGNCAVVCPGSLIAVGQKAQMKYPKDCWGCCSCIKECPKGAIAFYLGADIGGAGSKMTVRPEGSLLKWNIETINGETHTIVINRKESNQY